MFQRVHHVGIVTDDLDAATAFYERTFGARFRDRERLEQCRERTRVSPLGSGALAGSTLPLDRAYAAKYLGLLDARGRPRLTQNSMDAVSDRDFAIEFCSVAALAAVHLSRLAEDVILWASSEFNFIKIADAYTTGSRSEEHTSELQSR